eukprot:1107176-Rhodomonas_salina.5
MTCFVGSRTAGLADAQAQMRRVCLNTWHQCVRVDVVCLSVCRCQLVELPPQLFGLQLKTLDLQNNQFTAVTDDFQKLKTLNILLFSNNKLRSTPFPATLPATLSLPAPILPRILALRELKPHGLINDAVHGVRCSETRGCGRSSIPGFWTSMPALKRLSIDGNPIDWNDPVNKVVSRCFAFCFAAGSGADRALAASRTST